MIIPPDLKPLPVSPEDRVVSTAGDDFVSASAVRQLLVGPMAITGRPTRMFCDPDGFAGRSEFQPVCDSPFIALAADAVFEAEPVERVAAGGVHPAMTPPRRAPKPPRASAINRQFERTRGGDRWWMLGLGVVISTLLVSGGLVELMSTLALPERAPASEARIGKASVNPPATPLTLETDRTIAAAENVRDRR